MTAKEFFQQVRTAENELKMIAAKCRHYEDIGLSMAINISGMPSSGKKGTSRVEMAAVGATDALTALEAQRAHYSRIIAQAEAVINLIPQEKYRQILNYRYLCGWSFRSISDELEYNDPNSIYRAHGWALAEAQKVIDSMEELT